MNAADTLHTPALLGEVVAALAVRPGGRYVDATLGTGGHAAAILGHSTPGGQLLGIDADPEAIAIARERLADWGNAVCLVNDNFVNLSAICRKYDFSPVNGILFDLGLSSLELESERGFSFQHDDPLDMRFDPRQKLTAADVVNTYPETRLAGVIWEYGEEPTSRQIARAIVRNRPLKTTGELARLIERVAGGRRGKIHPATQTFQALRIETNQELDNLRAALSQAVNLLGFEGRLAVISYHSLEDRIVKQFLQQESRDCVCPPGLPVCRCQHTASLRLVHRKVITPAPEEVYFNPRARSAKLRIAERVLTHDDRYLPTERLGADTLRETKGWRRPSRLPKLRPDFLSRN